MSDAAQVLAYASADFSDGDQHAVALIEALLHSTSGGSVPAVILDRDAGPGTSPAGRHFLVRRSSVWMDPRPCWRWPENGRMRGLSVDFRCSTLQELVLNGRPDRQQQPSASPA